MSDLKLMPSDQPTPFEQRLLDAVANEAPSAEQRARVRRALGLPAGAPPPAPPSPVAGRALLVKVGAGLGLVSGALLVLFFITHGSRAEKQPTSPNSTQPSAAVPEAAVPAAPVVAPSVRAEPSVVEPSAAPGGALHVLEGHEESAPAKRSTKLTPTESAPDLSEQLRLIDAARAAVAAGNASAASAALSSYRTRFPRGPFGQEAAVLQIQTLDLQGNHALAVAQARSFLARYPNSPHVTVVRRIAGP